MVDQLKVMLIKLRPEIDQKEEDTQKLVVDLEKQKAASSETEKLFAEEQKESEGLFNQVQEIKIICDKDLAAVIPLMNSAIAALDTLNKKDIDEMKAYPNPPKLLKPVIEAVCLLQGVPETWD